MPSNSKLIEAELKALEEKLSTELLRDSFNVLTASAAKSPSPASVLTAETIMEAVKLVEQITGVTKASLGQPPLTNSTKTTATEMRMRQEAKALLWGQLYGMGTFKMAHFNLPNPPHYGAIPTMTTAQPVSLDPPSNLLIGGAGTGKTWSIWTLLAAGLEVRMLATERAAPNRVIAAVKTMEKDPKKQDEMLKRFDWKFISPSPPNWSALKESAETVNKFSLEDIAKMRTGIAKSDGKQWIEVLNSCAEFISDKDGEILGDVTEWGSDCAFVIDGLTGINTMSRNLTVGLKPNPAPGEWGVMQGNILNLLGKLASDCKCFFVCIAHVERENNEVTGISQVTVSTLGAKLAPKLPPLFANVIYSVRDKDKFSWSTAALGVDCKAGDLPIQDNLLPDFRPLVESYRQRVKAASGAAVAA